jgi:hypothetical protein
MKLNILSIIEQLEVCIELINAKSDIKHMMALIHLDSIPMCFLVHFLTGRMMFSKYE